MAFDSDYGQFKYFMLVKYLIEVRLWVLAPYKYDSPEMLLSFLDEKVMPRLR